MAYANCSSLNAQRSSMLPPPRTNKITSTSAAVLAALNAVIIPTGASGPCTSVGYITIGMCGARRAKVLSTSFNAAACGEVMMPIARGWEGISCLAASSNKPAFANFSLSLRKAS